MSFIGDLFNGSQGAGFQAQGVANQQGFTNQANQLQGQIGSAANAQGLVQGNQSALVNQMQGNIGAEQGLAGQLQGTVAGTGPNAAKAMLQQATSAGIQNAAAAAANAKGVNPAMAAKMANQTAAQNLQTGANQAAQLQGQQSLAAESQLGNVYSNIGGQQNNIGGVYGQMSNADLEQQQMAQNALTAQNNAIAGNISSQNSANAGVAQQNVQAQSNLMGNVMGAGGALLGLAKGGMIPRYADGGGVNVNVGSSDNSLNAATGESNVSGPTSKVGKALVNGMQGNAGYQIGSGVNNLLGKGLGAIGVGSGGSLSSNIGNGLSSGANALGNVLGFGGGNTAPQAAVTPTPLSNLAMQNTMNNSSLLSGKAPVGAGPSLMAKGGKASKKSPVIGEMLAAMGKQVPGKAKKQGDSYSNDTVPAVLSPGEIVIPRSIAQSKDAPQKAAKFVAAIMAKNGLK